MSPGRALTVRLEGDFADVAMYVYMYILEFRERREVSRKEEREIKV